MGSIHITVLVVTVIFIVVSRKVMKGRVNRKIYRCLKQENYADLYKVIDCFECRMSYPIFDREFLYLNSYIKQGDTKKVKLQMDFIFNKIRITNDQKLAVCRQGFYYYLKKNDNEECDRILKKLSSIRNHRNEVQTMKIMYDILIKKNSKHIAEVKEKLKSAKVNGVNKESIGILEYLIGIQYSYLNDYLNMKKYLNLALEYCINTPYENEIRELLNKH